MKRARDDDDDAAAIGDDSRHSYLNHCEDDDDEEEQEQVQRRREACDVLLSLSSCSWPSSSCSSIQADQQEASGMAARPLKRRRRGRDDEFECQTCGRRFPTFQALGGHRTSHLRRPATANMKPRPKAVLVHACTICGLGFSTGQALGGHMRRHRLGRADNMGSGEMIIVHARPASASSSLQLLNLFV